MVIGVLYHRFEEVEKLIFLSPLTFKRAFIAFLQFGSHPDFLLAV